MGYKDSIERASREALIKLTADKILQGIEKVEENVEISSRRWLWELMQNASDVPNKWGGVSIKLILSKNSIKICHNGDPFSIQNLTNLIQQVSSKEEDDENDFIGKFGTGFMVTHLLSKVIKLQGVLKEENFEPFRFNIKIDRDAQDSKSLSNKIQDLISEVADVESNPNFKKIIKYNVSENDFETVFEYPLNANTLLYAKDGIKDMINTLPLTQIFVKKIKRLIVVDQINSKEYDYQKIFHKDTNVYEIKSEQESDFFWVKSSDNIQLALRVTSNKNLTPKKWNPSTPKLYRDFPLVGSEGFASPFVINSHSFYPDETRSSLLLVNEDSQKVLDNRELLIEAFKLAEEYISELQSLQNSSNNYLLIKLNPSFFESKDVQNWFDTEISHNYRSFILNNLKIKNQDNQLSTFKDLKIPFLNNIKTEVQDSFYDLCNSFFPPSSLISRDSL